MQRQNESRIQKQTIHRLPLPTKTKHAQLQIQHRAQNLGKNHNHNQTITWLQAISIRNILGRKPFNRVNLILECVFASV